MRHVKVKHPGDDKGEDDTSQHEIEEAMAMPEASCSSRLHWR